MSIATFSPAFFIAVSALAPTIAAPAATSKATFSLVLHST